MGAEKDNKVVSGQEARGNVSQGIPIREIMKKGSMSSFNVFYFMSLFIKSMLLLIIFSSL